MKVRSLLELQNKLDEDISWRKKEFTTLKFMVGDARKHERMILLRASITLLYAHWEGHIKHCSLVYLLYIKQQSPAYEDMTDNFIQMSLGEKFSSGFSIKKFSSQKCLYDYINRENKEKFNIDANTVINTESNLKYDVVLNILGQLGLDTSIFELKQNFIDSKLLRLRNSIAHGDRVNVDDLNSTYDELKVELLNMIQIFHDLIRSAAENKQYLK